MKKIILSLILVAALTAGAVSGLVLLRPAPRGAEDSPAFTSIFADITAITAVPHTAGSPENAAVRDKIVERAEGLGLAPEVLPFTMDVAAYVTKLLKKYENGSALYRQRMDTYIQEGGYASLEEMTRDCLNAGEADELNLNNILVKVSGTAPTGSIMFVSHYDHVKDVPGAADDALAVACMLNLMETMAAAVPVNDVYFLFTDGEENGLLGAADFVDTQPAYAEEIDVLFNFEARGNRGGMLMFETSGVDYELVRRFKDNVPQPITMSIATAIYGMMPNSTDYTEFKNAGYHGLNFAMIEGDETYHHPSDNVDNLNRDTAWQYHQTMAALGEYFANTDLADITHNQSALYFPLPLVGIVVIPGWLGMVLGFLPLALALLCAVLTVRRKERRHKALRVTGLLLLGVIPAAVTLFFFAGSYMLSLPAILFLLSDLWLDNARGKAAYGGFALLAFTLFFCGVLYMPLAFLVQIALKLWYATALLALLPLIPAVSCGVKAIRSAA